MGISVKRAGATASFWYDKGKADDVQVRDGNVSLDVFVSVTKGYSRIRIEFDAEEFANLADVMMRANRREAIRAFGRSLSKYQDEK